MHSESTPKRAFDAAAKATRLRDQTPRPPPSPLPPLAPRPLQGRTARPARGGMHHRGTATLAARPPHPRPARHRRPLAATPLGGLTSCRSSAPSGRPNGRRKPSSVASSTSARCAAIRSVRLRCAPSPTTATACSRSPGALLRRDANCATSRPRPRSNTSEPAPPISARRPSTCTASPCRPCSFMSPGGSPRANASPWSARRSRAARGGGRTGRNRSAWSPPPRTRATGSRR